MTSATTTNETHDWRSLWIAIAVWCVILLTFTQFRNRNPAELMKGGGFDWQVKFQAAMWVCLGLLGLCLLASGRADLRLVRSGPLFWYACFVAFAFASALWSGSSAYTAYRAVQHGVALVLIISLREHLGNLNVFLVIYVGINWVLVLMSVSGLHGGIEWIAAPQNQADFLAKAGTKQWRFTSAAGHPSYVSIVAAVGAISLSARAAGQHWMSRSLGCGWLIVTTILTVSRTAIAGLGGGLLLVAYARQKLAMVVCTIGILLPLALMQTSVLEKTAGYLRRGQTTQQFTSMTGRLPIYEKVIRRAQDNMIKGEGFQSVRVDPVEEGWLHAHNVFLESLTSLGIIGVVLTSMVLLTTGANIASLLLRHFGQRGPGAIAAWENAGMAVPLLAFCLLDSGFLSAINAVVMTYMAVIAKVRMEVLEGEAAKVVNTQRGPVNALVRLNTA